MVQLKITILPMFHKLEMYLHYLLEFRCINIHDMTVWPIHLSLTSSACRHFSVVELLNCWIKIHLWCESTGVTSAIYYLLYLLLQVCWGGRRWKTRCVPSPPLLSSVSLLPSSSSCKSRHWLTSFWWTVTPQSGCGHTATAPVFCWRLKNAEDGWKVLIQ